VPHDFKDNQNQKWILDLDLWKAREIRNKTGIDICSNEGCDQLFNSVIDRFAILFAICEDQAAEFKVSADEFSGRLKGGFLDSATLALLGECETFYQDHELKYLALVMEKLIPLYMDGQKKLEESIQTGQASRVLDREIMSKSQDGNG